MTITLYHNPRCSKSRAALDLLRERGIEPRIVEYLKEPPSVEELKRILDLRAKEAQQAGLDNPNLSEDALIEGMVAHPIVIERPIVVNGGRARLGRPPERVLEIL